VPVYAVRMGMPVDLDPRDGDTRRRIQARLRKIREDAGLTQQAAGVHQLEAGTNWQTITLQRWARILGWRIVFDPHGIPQPSEPDPLDDIYARVTPKTPADEDEIHLLRLRNLLIRSRVAGGMSIAGTAHRWGVSPKAVRNWENETTSEVLVMSLQRATRALGGELRIKLAKVK
jgi:DNA-binding XRE family transcriptional regulator